MPKTLRRSSRWYVFISLKDRPVPCYSQGFVESSQEMWDRKTDPGKIPKWVPHRLTSEAGRLWSGATSREGSAGAKQISKTSLGCGA